MTSPTNVDKIAQVSVSLITLAYSWDAGSNSTGIHTVPGRVNVSKIDCYYLNNTCTTNEGFPEEIAPARANAFGDITRSLARCNYNTDDDIYKAGQQCSYFKSKIGHEFAYRYSQYNQQDVARTYPYLTKRIIKVSSGPCQQYELVSLGTDKYGLGLWTFKNETGEELQISIPPVDTAFDSTTYIYNGTKKPQNATLQACGSRCLYVYALRGNGTIRKHQPSLLYKCPISVGDVTNINDPAHVLPNDTARLAAASIALTGRYTNLLDKRVREWRQYQLYAHG